MPTNQFGTGTQTTTVSADPRLPPVRPRKIDDKPQQAQYGYMGRGLFGAPPGWNFGKVSDPTAPGTRRQDAGLGTDLGGFDNWQGGWNLPPDRGGGGVPGGGGPGAPGGGPATPGTPGSLDPFADITARIAGGGRGLEAANAASTGFDLFTGQPTGGGTQNKDANIDRLTEQFVGDLMKFGQPSNQQGLINLFNILQSQGQMDPAIMNNQLSAISRDTAANQSNVQGQFAQQGIQNSGVAQAISAALGQAGVDKQADVRLADQEAAEQRRRQDLQLLNELLFGTTTSLTGANLGVPIGPREPSDLETGLNIGGDVLDLVSTFRGLRG